MRYLGPVAEKVARKPEGTFVRTSSIDVPATTATVARALDHLAEDGVLIALDRGLWFKPHPDGSGPDPVSLAVQVMADLSIRDGFGPTGAAALAHLDLGVWPKTSTIAVAGHTLSPVEGLRFVRRSGRKSMSVSDVAVLEVLRAWPVLDDLSWKGFTEQVVELHVFGKVNVERIVRGAKSERANVVKERAGILLRAVKEA